MNPLKFVPAGVSRMFGKLWLKVQKASPELYIAGGLVAGVGALVLVGVKTWQNKDILAEDYEKIKEAKSVGTTIEKVPAKDPEGNVDESVVTVVTTKRPLTEEEQKALWANRINFGRDIAHTYWLPTAVAIVAGVLIAVGKNKYAGMLSAAAAAYATLSEDVNKYRKLVADEIGKEKEEQLFHGYLMEEHVDTETGKTEKVPVKAESGSLSPYSFWFDEGVFDDNTLECIWRNNEFDRDKLTNRLRVKQVQEEAQRNLRTIGYAWLEDVALKLGIDPDVAKQWHYIGWLYDPKGENRVSLGVLEDIDQLEVNKGFCDDTCSQNKCLISPNVTGYIGFVRDDYRKFDMRYGFGKRHRRDDKAESERIIHRYNKEKMERMIFNNMSENGKFNLLRRATRSMDY